MIENILIIDYNHTLELVIAICILELYMIHIIIVTQTVSDLVSPF